MSLQENRLIVDFKKSMEVHSDFKKFYSRKQIPAFCNYNTSLSKDENLSNLCLHFLNIDASTCDAFSYRPILIEIIARLIHNPQIEKLIMLSKVLKYCIHRPLSTPSLMKSQFWLNTSSF